jgi:hypothetical protein
VLWILNTGAQLHMRPLIRRVLLDASAGTARVRNFARADLKLIAGPYLELFSRQTKEGWDRLGGSALRSWSRDYPTSAIKLDAVAG